MLLPSEILKTSEFFKGISGRSRDLISGLCIPKTLKKKETLFSEGEQGSAVYLSGRGSIQLSKIHPGGKETVIKIIESGEMFGEVVLFENSAYPVTATALSKAVVYVLPRRDFLGLLNNETFRNDFIAMLMKKQRYLAEQIHNLSTYTAEERFLRFILGRHGNRKEYEVNLSKKDIAAAIGTNPETLSRIFASLKRKGMLEFDGKKIRLKNL